MRNTKPHCLTLRIDPEIDDLVCEASHERRISKSAWIRAAIRQSLARKITIHGETNEHRT